MRFTVKSNIDIHIRPAVTISEIAQKSGVSVFIYKNNKKCHAKSLEEVELMEIKKGDFVDIETEDNNVLNELINAFETMTYRGLPDGII